MGTDTANATIFDESAVAPTTNIDAPLGTNPTDKLGDKPVVSISATDPTAVEGTANSTLVFTVAQSNPSTQATDIVVTLNLGTVSTADITSITYVDASGATVTTTVAALQAGLALTIPATPNGAAPYSPVFTITAAQDAIYEVSEALTMNLALATGETDATLGTAQATGTILDESSITASDITGGNNLGDQPVVSISATDAAAVEGTTNNTIVFTVSQTNLSTVDTTVLVKGTLGAISAADLTSISYTNAAGTVVTLSTPSDIASFFSTGVTVKIPAGSTSAPVITFTAANDVIFEQAESFSVAISAPVNASLGTDRGTATISDSFLDGNEAVFTNEDTPISGNVIDTVLSSINSAVVLTGFAVDTNNDGTLETFVAGDSANILGVGSIAINANGTYTFIPVANWNGTVPTVTYYLSDNAGATIGDTSTLSIVVNPVNDTFIDGNESVITPEDTPIGGNVIDGGLTSGDGPISISGFIVDGVVDVNSHLVTFRAGDIVNISGIGTLTIAANGAYTFTPATNWNGTVPTVTYSLTDSYGVEEVSTLDIVVTPVNNAPIAIDDIYKAIGTKDTLSLSALNADRDPDGDTLSIISINGVALTPGIAQAILVNGGVVKVAADGAVTFMPNPGFTGKATIPYVISDGHGGTATANEIITVNSDNPTIRGIPTFYKPWEHKPIEMGKYEFNRVVLDFNGIYGGINQFSLPHGETTNTRDALEHSNDTPYVPFDRVGDEVRNAQRSLDANLALTRVDDPELMAVLSPPEVQLGADKKASYTLPSGVFTGGKGTLKLAAFTKDGKPLPRWMKFNPFTGEFDLAMPDDVNEPIEVQIVATDAKGDQAKTKLNIKPPVKPAQKAAFIGKSSLTSQIRSAMTFGRG